MQTHNTHEFVTSEHMRGLAYIAKKNALIEEPITLYDGISTDPITTNWHGEKVILNKIDEYGIHKEYYWIILSILKPSFSRWPATRNHADICITIGEGMSWSQVNEPLMNNLNSNANITIRDMLHGLFDDLKKSEVETNKLNA